MMTARTLTAAGALGLCLGCGAPPTLEPVFEGCTTDENWRTMDDFETSSPPRIVTDPSNTPVWTLPAPGSTTPFPAGAPPTLSWHRSMVVPGLPAGDEGCNVNTPMSIGGLRPEHLPAISGDIFDLHFAVGGVDQYRVMTTYQQTAVPAATWMGWAGKQVQITLYRAQILLDVVTPDGGPWEAAPVTVTITQ